MIKYLEYQGKKRVRPMAGELELFLKDEFDIVLEITK